jgi:hypothetical protein
MSTSLVFLMLSTFVGSPLLSEMLRTTLSCRVQTDREQHHEKGNRTGAESSEVRWWRFCAACAAVVFTTSEARRGDH